MKRREQTRSGRRQKDSFRRSVPPVPDGELMEREEGDRKGVEKDWTTMRTVVDDPTVIDALKEKHCGQVVPHLYELPKQH